MPLGSSLNSLLLLAKNLDVKNPTVMPVKKDKNDKPVVFTHHTPIKFLPRSVPEEEGVSSEYLESFINEINSDLSIRLNRLLIVKNDKVIYERYETPFVKDAWDCVFSCSKTLVALALGFLYDEGKIDLDTPVCRYLKNEKTIKVAKNKKITLRHLLTMSTGSTFNEMETASSKKWVRDFFDSTTKFKIGTKFEYNSLNTYIVSAVVEKVSGIKFADFVQERLFNPLNINDTHLDTSPEGYFKGGWGLYILPEDMAKLGILVMDDGIYNGTQILSKEWISLMSHTQFKATNFNHVYDYGFQMWTKDDIGFSVFNGMYDQNVMIYRNSGIIVVTCCANNEAFHGSNLFKLGEKYFANKEPGGFPLCETHGSHNLTNNESLMYYYDLIANKEYHTVGKVANSCGVLPVILQNELGTYSQGIKSVFFLKEGTSYALNVREGNKNFVIKFDFNEGVRAIYDFYGNKFDCVADARFILSGKSDPFLVIRLFFLEFSSSRYFTIKFGKDNDIVSMELSENPGLDFVNTLIDIQDESTKSFIYNLSQNINPSLVAGIIKNIFSPSFLLIHGQEKSSKVKIEKKKTPAKAKK